MKYLLIIAVVFSFLGCSKDKDNDFDQTNISIVMHVERVNSYANTGTTDVTASIGTVKSGVLKYPDVISLNHIQYYQPGSDIYLKVLPHNDYVKIKVGTNLRNNAKVNYIIDIKTTSEFEKHFTVISEPPYLKYK